MRASAVLLYEDLASGIPPQVVMKRTCHCDYKSMKPYIGIAEKTKADAMKLFDEEFAKILVF